MKTLYATAGAVLVLAQPAAAATITPVSVTASNTFELFGQYRAENLINGSGLSNNLHNDDFAAMWLTNLGVQQATLTFDLGSVQTLGAINLWQYNLGVAGQFASTLERGVKDFNVLTSVDGISFSDALSGTLAIGTGQPLAAQSFDLAATVRYVRVDILNNYTQGLYNERDSAVGLSEVRFETAAAVPEPATWAMMIGGFGLVGGAMRRRQVRVVFA